MALGLQIDSFRSLKHGRAQARRPVFTLTAMLILMRLGKLRTIRDVLNLRTTVALENIEKLTEAANAAGIPKLPPGYRCPGRKGHPTTMI
ncbi:MAG: hypothetical protein ABI651_15250 [Verrucomicrobiota bacterium]